MVYIYDAFISYRHADLDSKIAKRIQHQLERYRIPNYIRKQTGRKNGFRIFRDKDELPVTDDLGDVLHTALRNSAYLIVICSPNTADSEWVKKEIEYFLETHERSSVLTVLADGEADLVIPETLRMENGSGREKEIVACDYRRASEANRHNELHRLAAAILKCKYSELVNRARKNNLIRRAFSVMAFSFVLTVLAYNNYEMNQANRQLQETNDKLYQENQENLRKESLLLANESVRAMDAGNRVGALKYALEALPSEEKDRPYVPEAEKALAEATGVYSEAYEIELKKQFIFNNESGEDLDVSVTEYEGEEYMTIVNSRNNCSLWKMRDKDGNYLGEKLFEKNIESGMKAFLAKNGKLILTDSTELVTYNMEAQSFSFESRMDIRNVDDGYTDRIYVSPEKNGILFIYEKDLIYVDLADYSVKKYTFNDLDSDLYVYDEWSRNSQNLFLSFEDNSTDTDGKISIRGVLFSWASCQIIDLSLEAKEEWIPESNPLLINERLYICLGDELGEEYLTCFNLEDEVIEWKRHLTTMDETSHPRNITYMGDNRLDYEGRFTLFPYVNTIEKYIGCILGNDVLFFDYEGNALKDLQLHFKTDIAEINCWSDDRWLFLLDDNSLCSLSENNSVEWMGMLEMDQIRKNDTESTLKIFTDQSLYITGEGYAFCFELKHYTPFEIYRNNNHLPVKYYDRENKYKLCPYGIIKVSDKGTVSLFDKFLKTEVWCTDISYHDYNYEEWELTPSREVMVIFDTSVNRSCKITVVCLKDGSKAEIEVDDFCNIGIQITDHYLYYENTAGINRIKLSGEPLKTHLIYEWENHLNPEILNPNTYKPYCVSPSDIQMVIQESNTKYTLVNLNNGIMQAIPDDFKILKYIFDNDSYTIGIDSYTIGRDYPYSVYNVILSEELMRPVIWSTNDCYFVVADYDKAVIYNNTGDEQFRISLTVESDLSLWRFIDDTLYLMSNGSFLLTVYNIDGTETAINLPDTDNEEDIILGQNPVIPLSEDTFGCLTAGRYGDNLVVIDKNSQTVKYSINNVVDVVAETNEFLQEQIIVEEDGVYQSIIQWKNCFSLEKLIQYGNEMLENLEVIYESKDDNDESHYSNGDEIDEEYAAWSDSEIDAFSTFSER